MTSARPGLAVIAATLLLGLPLLGAADDENDSNWPALGGADGLRISHETGQKHRVTRFGFVLARRRRLLDFEENRSEFSESARGRTGRGHRIDS